MFSDSDEIRFDPSSIFTFTHEILLTNLFVIWFRSETTRCVRVVAANALKGACENGFLDNSRLYGRIYIGSYASASPAGDDWIRVPR